MEEKLYRIWYEEFDDNGFKIGEGVYYKAYKRKGYALRVARKRYGRTSGYGIPSPRWRWIISTENPFVGICDVCGKEHPISLACGTYVGNGHYFFTNFISARISDRCSGTTEDFCVYVCPDCMDKIDAYVGKLHDELHPDVTGDKRDNQS